MDMELFGERFSVTAATDKGPRRENQDTFAWAAVTSGEMVGSAPNGDMEQVPDDRPDLLVAVVCDGMGGMNAGAEASAIATRSVIERAKGAVAEDHDAFVGSIVDAISDADQMLEAMYPGTGTTVSVIAASAHVLAALARVDDRMIKKQSAAENAAAEHGRDVIDVIGVVFQIAELPEVLHGPRLERPMLPGNEHAENRGMLRDLESACAGLGCALPNVGLLLVREVDNLPEHHARMGVACNRSADERAAVDGRDIIVVRAEHPV